MCSKCGNMYPFVNIITFLCIFHLTTMQCNEQQPAFRAFLKTHDRSPSTHMKTLTELLLAPTRHIMDYSRLLVALEHWTPEEHADRPDLAQIQQVFKQLKKFCDEVCHASHINNSMPHKFVV